MRGVSFSALPFSFIPGPILDPNEFSARYIAHANGSHPIGADGAILAMLLVVWASSFGLDERGLPIQDSEDTYPQEYIENSRHTRRSNSNTVRPADSTRKDSTDLMLREVLDAVDLHGLMRRPTWDGVRVLLLLLPLLEGKCLDFSLHPAERPSSLRRI